ncbi:hypothetical protein GCM10029978_046240 [Actinoallomurus acanthiterrae]
MTTTTTPTPPPAAPSDTETTATTTPPGTPPVVPVTGFAVRHTPTGRLGQGELRRQVAAHLLANPGSDFTPGQIARALGDRSSGAVANALETLVDHGHAQLTTAKPRRFRATDTTAEATKGGSGVTRPRTAPAQSASSATSGAPSSGTATPGRAASVTPSAAPALEAGGGVRRPNGQTYHPRQLADLPDVTALRKLRTAGIPALLYGPPVIHGT